MKERCILPGKWHLPSHWVFRGSTSSGCSGAFVSGAGFPKRCAKIDTGDSIREECLKWSAGKTRTSPVVRVPMSIATERDYAASAWPTTAAAASCPAVSSRPRPSALTTARSAPSSAPCSGAARVPCNSPGPRPAEGSGRGGNAPPARSSRRKRFDRRGPPGLPAAARHTTGRASAARTYESPGAGFPGRPFRHAVRTAGPI